jgi:hypothetical protein
LEGYHVTSFGDGQSLLSAARARTPSCIILDVHMPGRSGLEILQARGGHDYAAPVFIISGQGDIPMATIDGLGLVDVDFIKIDCEGYEVRALHGAFQTLRMYHPVLLIEVNEGALSRQGVKPSDIFDILDDLGYVSVNIHKGQPMAGPQYDILCTWNT